MSNYRSIIEKRFNSSSSIFKRDDWKQRGNISLRTNTFEHYQRQISHFEWNINLNQESCPVLAVAHATSYKKAKYVVVSGFASLSSLDDGFYGKGMYFSSSAIYTIPYCMNVSDPCMVICFLIAGNPFPVIEHPKKKRSLMGSPIISGYQSHYVMTKINGLPFNDDTSAKNRKFNEIVIDQEAQVVPIFLVEIDPKNFDELSKSYHREILEEYTSELVNSIPFTDSTHSQPRDPDQNVVIIN